jgi:heptosyltransferase-1
MFVGPAVPREWPARLLYDAMIETHSEHVIDQAGEIVGAGVELSPPASRSEWLPQTAEAESWAQQFVSDRIAILNPAAGWPAKQWPADRYGELAKKLAARGFRVLVNLGPGEDEIGAAVIDASGKKSETISCTIPQLIALTRHTKLFVGGDTGPMHLAALLGVPTVAIFGPTDPARNGPYYERTAVVRSPLSATSYSHVSHPDPGLMSITVDEVMAAVEKVLA